MPLFRKNGVDVGAAVEVVLMAPEKSPAFQFYIRDWRSSRKVQVMSFKERGMYLEMLIEQWDKGAAPSSAAACALSLGGSEAEWTRSWGALSACFSPRKRDGGLINAKLEAIRRDKRKYIKTQQGNALTKWNIDKPSTMTRGQRLSEARKRGTHTKQEWTAMEATYGRCLRCDLSNDRLVGGHCIKDHVIPLYQGGDDSIQNIQPMCRNCNSTKGSDHRDYRVGLPETRAEWLPNACRMPTDACSASATASATATADQKNPLTPFQGARVTRADKKLAKEIRSKRFGRCSHDPECEDGAACEALLAREIAARRVAS